MSLVAVFRYLVVLVLVTVGVPVLLPAGPARAVVACGAGTVTVARVSAPKIYLEAGTTPPLNSAYAMYKLTNSSGSAYADLWAQIGSFAGPKIGKASSESGRAHPGALANGASTNAAFYLTASGESLAGETHVVSVYSTRPDLASGPVCTAQFTLAAEEDIAASANKVTAVSVSTAPQLGGRFVVTVTGSTGTIGSGQQLTATPASYASWPANAFRLVGSRITMTGGNTGVHVDKLYLPGLNPANTDYTAEFTFAVVGTTAGSTPVSPMNHISSGTQTKHTTTGNFATLAPIAAVVNATTLGVAASPSTLPASGGTATYTATVTNGGSLPVALDDLTVTLPAGVSYVPGSATFAGTATPDPAVNGSTAVFVGDMGVPANGTRTLTLQVLVPGTPGTYTATATGHIASVTVDTTTGTGDSAPASTGITVAGPPPSLTGIAPTTGPADGGTSVTLTGTDLTTATAVKFGSQDAASFDVDNSTTITAVSPPGTGAVPVTVVTAGGTTPVVVDGTFTYSAPATPAPAPADETSSGTGPDPQSVTLTLPQDGTLALLDADDEPTTGPVPVTGQGTYTVAGNVVTFTPVPGYTGTADPVTFRVTDKYQRSGDATYTPTVNPPAAPSAPARTSSGTGTAPQSVTVTVPAGGAVTLVDGGSPTGTVTTPAGTYTLAGATITFVAVDGFSGNPPAATYRVTDAYNQSGTGSYQPTVNAPAGPAAAPKTTTGQGTAVQTTAVTVPQGGRLRLVDGGDEVVSIAVDGEGTYAATGTDLTFTPEPGFAGTATAVDYRVTDAYDQAATSTYTATVTPPPPPTAPDRTTSGVGTTPQASALPVPPGGTIALVGPGNTQVTSLTVAGKGTCTLTLAPEPEAFLTAPADGADATVTFVPVLGYTGTAPPITYRVTDAYGQAATATYTPTVTLPAITAPPKTSTGTQTSPQSTVLPVPPGGSVVLIDGGQETTTVAIRAQGTYRLTQATGALSFTPLATFAGVPRGVTYKITDAYGQSATATYTPSVVASAGSLLPVTGDVPVDWTLTGLILLAVGAVLRADGLPRPGWGRAALRRQGFWVSRWARKP